MVEPSADEECLLSPSLHDNVEINLKPFSVFHRLAKTRKARRKIDMSQTRASPTASTTPKLEGQTAQPYHDGHLYNLKIDAFNCVWSKIDTTIKDVLRNINLSIFNDVNTWVHESFKAIRSSGAPGFVEATRSYPVVTDALSKQLSAGLVYTKNMEFVDDQLTFEELGVHLKSHGCFVANLSSMDFLAKNGIEGCLASLWKQFSIITLDAADMSILASWCCGQKESKPVVIIIEDMERCCGSILSNFILMLSEWVVKVPTILIMGVATTLDAPSSILSSNALQRLRPTKFVLGSPGEKMDALIEAVLLKPCSWFNLGHKVAVFMRDYFLKHDGTLASFTRVLKIACMQHFFTQPLSFLLKDRYLADEQIFSDNSAFNWDMVLKLLSQLDSCKSISKPTGENLAKSLAELKTLHKRWATVILCLYEVGKPRKIPLLDLYCEALDSGPHRSGSYCNQGTSSSTNGCSSNQPYKRLFISQAVQKVRELPPAALCGLLNSWERLADGICEIHEKVKDLQSMMKLEAGKSSEYESTDAPLRHSSQGISAAKDVKLLNEKAVMLIEWMIRDHMKPIESLPLHEIFCFKDVDMLHRALLGDPRKKIQADLLESHKRMCCSCCSNQGNRLLASLHDTSVMYILAQEHGDIINVHDWYQSFKATIIRPSTKARNKSKHSPSSKKRKNIDASPSFSEAAIQAQFCRAVSELQVTGLIRMPSKRRPDFVQRVAFGL
uniref:Uncharacterized protein n=1 Tax=Opuntia streptacantha TaxID=393608 RepID=A0A7C9A6G5_OPUST